MYKRRSRINNRRRKEKKFNWSIIIKITIAMCIVFIATFFAILNMGSNKIINNIYINEVSVSALSTDGARNKLQPLLKEELEKQVSIKFEDYEYIIIPEEIDFSYELSGVLEEAYGCGRTGNILTNNIRILMSLFMKKKLEAPIVYNSDKLEKIIDNISVEIPNIVVEPTYYIRGDQLIFTKGNAGNTLDKETTKEFIISAIKEKKDTIALPVNKTEPKSIDIAKVHEEIYREPQNAYIKKEPYSISVEKKGIDFAVSLEEAKKIIEESKESEVYIPLKYTEPEITVADLGEDIFGNIISTCTTKYDVTNTNRATNLEIAINKINGTVLAPGEEFSFNKVVGERTSSNGFKEAVIYADGELDYGIGGGICQISSNLYNSVINANLEIIERKNHSMTVNYVPIGCDATVAYGSIDFKFKNSRNYPIKIVATINSGVITVSICGVNEEKEYDNIEIVVETTQKDDFETSYEYLSSIPEGTENIKQTGKYGYKCSTYRVLRKNNEIISKELLSTDTYKPQKQIIQVHK